MNKKVAALIKEACEAEGVEVEIYEDYSGRGMYGAVTDAISFPQYTRESDIQFAVSRNPHLWEENDIREPRIGSYNSDNFGLGMIIY